MKVLLVQANTVYSSVFGTHFGDKDIFTSPEISEHLGLGYICAYLIAKGIECKVVDGALMNLSNHDLINMCVEFTPSLIGLTLIHDTFPETLDTFNQLKNNVKTPIVIGGHLPTIAGKKIFKYMPGLKYSIVGEAEESFYKFCKAFGNREFYKVPNLIYKNRKGKICENKINGMMDIDSLPFPKRTYNNEIFRLQSQFHLPKALRIHGSRGCHGSCNFCSIHSFRKRMHGENNWIPRSIDSIVDEIIMLNDKYKVKCFYFSDDNFLGPMHQQKSRIKKFCNRIKEKKLSIKFSITTRIDGLAYDLIEKLIGVGLTHIGVGLENINNQSLKDLGKGYNNSSVITLVEIGNSLPVSVSMSMILYHPFVKIEDIYDNYKFLKHIGYFDSKVKNRNAFDTLLQSRLLIRKYAPIEQTIINSGLHRGYYSKNPFIVKYDFKDMRVKVLWNKLFTLCKNDYFNVENNFLKTIGKLIDIDEVPN